jgi:anti-sigma B factor antagonist
MRSSKASADAEEAKANSELDARADAQPRQKPEQWRPTCRSDGSHGPPRLSFGARCLDFTDGERRFRLTGRKPESQGRQGPGRSGARGCRSRDHPRSPASTSIVQVEGQTTSADTPLVGSTSSGGPDSEIVVPVSGEIDLANAETLREPLADAIARRPHRVVVDLAKCRFMDSSGLQELLLARKNAHAHGVQIVLRSPSGLVRRTLESVGFDQIFLIYE